jgi:uncharacterized membrane protein YedE/YeeE
MDWIAPVAGGVLIGAAVVLLWLTLGRVAGISGIAANAMNAFRPDAPRRPGVMRWPLAFVAGLGIGGWLAYGFVARPLAPALSDVQIIVLIAAGMLVGVGTRLGSGCTSGHGVCGIARLSKRSFAATGVFLAVGMLTATLLHGA